MTKNNIEYSYSYSMDEEESIFDIKRKQPIEKNTPFINSVFNKLGFNNEVNNEVEYSYSYEDDIESESIIDIRKKQTIVEDTPFINDLFNKLGFNNGNQTPNMYIDNDRLKPSNPKKEMTTQGTPMLKQKYADVNTSYCITNPLSYKKIVKKRRIVPPTFMKSQLTGLEHKAINTIMGLSARADTVGWFSRIFVGYRHLTPETDEFRSNLMSRTNVQQIVTGEKYF